MRGILIFFACLIARAAYKYAKKIKKHPKDGARLYESSPKFKVPLMEKYPLEQITLIKQKKLDEAEKVLREKKLALEKEKEKLLAVEKERDTIKEHRKVKLTQVREHMDEGSPSAKIQQMRTYLKIVDEKLKMREVKVHEQKKAVVIAEKQVETAREDLIKKQQDVEKMKIHRKEWEKEIKAIEEQKENLEADEMGATLHQRRAVARKKHQH